MHSEDRIRRGDSNLSRIWLHLDLRDLAVLDLQRKPLGPVVAQEGSGIEAEAELRNELSCGIGEEADTGLVAGIKRIRPGIHHEGVVHADDVDVASGRGCGLADILGDVALRASWGEGG